MKVGCRLAVGVLSALVSSVAVAGNELPGVPVCVKTTEVRTDVDAVSRRLIGFNVPAGHTPRQAMAAAVRGPGTNGIWEALHALNPGLVRVWTSALELGLDTMQLPMYEARPQRTWRQWLAVVLADDAVYWRPFDQSMRQLASLGPETEIMLCLPAFPPWLGPFRAPSADAAMDRLIDLRSGKTVAYAEYPVWAGIADRMIADGAAFARFSSRVEAFTERLLQHCLRHSDYGRSVRYVSVGNEPDNPGGAERYVCWRMWVYGPDHKKAMEEKRPLTLLDQGLLQQIYLRVWRGCRAADPLGSVRVGGPETAWAHTQKITRGAFYYLDYFLKGGGAYYPDVPDQVAGVGLDTVDFLSYHSYSFRSEERYRHDCIVSSLVEAYGKPVFLTEYNATAMGHGMNFMQSGATAVGDAIIRLARQPGAAGAAFFKAAGGGFGLVLPRDGSLWHTGAYRAMDLFSRWVVGGRVLHTEMPAQWETDCLAVRQADGTLVVCLLNRSRSRVRFSLRLDPSPEGSAEARYLELPLATDRNDYRDVRAKDVRHEILPAREPLPLSLAPLGLVFLRWAPP